MGWKIRWGKNRQYKLEASQTNHFSEDRETLYRSTRHYRQKTYVVCDGKSNVSSGTGAGSENLC